jgi:hypothetical protein
MQLAVTVGVLCLNVLVYSSASFVPLRSMSWFLLPLDSAAPAYDSQDHLSQAKLVRSRDTQKQQLPDNDVIPVDIRNSGDFQQMYHV